MMKTKKIEKILYLDNENRINGKLESELASILFEEDAYTVYFYTVKGHEYVARKKTEGPLEFSYLRDSEDGLVKVCCLNDAMIMVKPEVYEELCQYLKKD